MRPTSPLVSVGLTFLALSLTSALTFDSYAPVHVECPTKQQWLRPAKGLSQPEEAWVEGRKSVVLTELSSYLQRLNISGLDVPKLTSSMKTTSNIPTISVAISGGGWGSGLTATGLLRALDSRFPDAIKQKTGGILQSLTYIAGLSGGSWPMTSLATHNFPSINDMVAEWHVFSGNASILVEDVAAKLKAGFNVSVTDLLGRQFGYEFLPSPRAGLNSTLSGVRDLSNFKNHSMPMPILQTNRYTPDDEKFFDVMVPYGNSSIFEMTPFEFGSWLPAGPEGFRSTGFMPMEYLGTKLHNGTLSNSSACVQGYDRASFLIGVAAAAFNFWYVEAKSNNTIGSFSKRSTDLVSSARFAKRGLQFPPDTVMSILDGFNEVFNLPFDEAMYPSIPNPYAGTTSSETEALQLVDGSETGQSIAYWGLIQPERKADFIITWDSNQDQAPYSWNNGTNTYNTFLKARAQGLPFPEVPPPATFIKRNYTTQPVFFGCDIEHTTTRDLSSPLVLYLANSPYSAYTNFTWFQSEFTPIQTHEILVNGFDITTQGNGTLDNEWSQCLGCATIDRSLSKMGMPRPQQCESCFAKYCWDGTYESEADIPVVDLPLLLEPNVSYAEWNATHGWT